MDSIQIIMISTLLGAILGGIVVACLLLGDIILLLT
jgi:hypothetical protein